MEMESGKLFIGGISWDTNEERLREYFQTFGQVIEAVIMKDRATGRARGFGFIVFLDPTVAQRVVQQKHIIDGRAVEAKKAVLRDDQQRSNGSVQGSPGPTRTKKIFVGGLASTVTETEFKNYFDQFGTTTDVVVMYDHNTQRPRGFGFITYESEESVDKVLLRTFHELNGKMVEVKRAVPKESSPGPNRSNNINGYNNGSSRITSYFNGYSQGYNPNSLGGFGRFSPVTVSRNGYSPFGRSSYNMGANSDSFLGTNYGIGNGNGNGNSGSSLGYGRVVKPMCNVSPNRYTDVIGYGGGGGGAGGDASVLNSTTMWGNGNQSYTNNSPNLGNFGNYYGNLGAIWGNQNSGEGVNGGVGGSNFVGGNGVNAIGYGRNGGNSMASYGAADDGGGSFYADSGWRQRSSSPDVEVPGLFSYGFGGDGGSEGIHKKAVGYVGYSVANRGIAA